jgi:hypothetical protein
MSLSRRQIGPATEKGKLATLAGFAPRLCDAGASAPEGNNDHEELELALVDAVTRAGWVLPLRLGDLGSKRRRGKALRRALPHGDRDGQSAR